MAPSYTITTIPGPRHTNLEINGELGPGMADALAKEVMAIFAQATAIKVLVDVRGLKVRVGPVETIAMVSSFKNMVPIPRPSKTAVLYKEGDHETLRFYETVALNRGYSTAIFTDMADAVRWLDV